MCGWLTSRTLTEVEASDRNPNSYRAVRGSARRPQCHTRATPWHTQDTTSPVVKNGESLLSARRLQWNCSVKLQVEADIPQEYV